MKAKINVLSEVLAYLLEGLSYTERKLAEEFPECCDNINSPRLQDVVSSYIGSTQEKLLKVDRVFNYLMKDPEQRSNKVIDELIAETRLMLSSTPNENIKDVLMIGCIRNINAYKIANYWSAYLMAIELELDTATDLVQQVLEWEVETSRELAALFIEEFNQNRIVKF